VKQFMQQFGDQAKMLEAVHAEAGQKGPVP